jgi:hypothetical protein
MLVILLVYTCITVDTYRHTNTCVPCDYKQLLSLYILTCTFLENRKVTCLYTACKMTFDHNAAFINLRKSYQRQYAISKTFHHIKIKVYVYVFYLCSELAIVTKIQLVNNRDTKIVCL